MPPLPTGEEQDWFELQSLEPRVLLSAEGLFAVAAGHEVLEAPGASLFNSAIIETAAPATMTAAAGPTATHAGEDLFGGASAVALEAPDSSGATPTGSAVAETTPAARAETVAPTVAPQPPTPTAPSALVPTAAAPTLDSTLPVTSLPNGPPAPAASSTPSQTSGGSTAAATLPLAATLTSAFSSLQAQLGPWGSYFNLSSIDFAGQGLKSLSLPVLPDSLNSLFDLGSKLSSVTLPGFSSADTKDTFVTQLNAAGFKITSIEGGISVGNLTIPASSGSTLLEGSFSLSVATGFSASPSYNGGSFNSGTPSVLAGLAGSSTLNGSITWSGSLSLTFNFAIDSSAGFQLLGDSALTLTVNGNGSLSGTAPIGGATGTAVTGTANASLTIALGFHSPTTRYSITQIGASTLAPVATGSAGLSLTFSTGPATLTFGASYNLTADLITRAVTQSASLTLTGKLELPGIKTTSGAPGAVTLTGSYNTSTQTWAISGTATSGLTMFGQTLNTLNVSTTITPGAFSGSFESSLQLDFLKNGSSPAVVNLSATYDRSVMTVNASATVATLNLGGSGSSRLLALTGATLGGTFSGNVATGALTGSLAVSATSATLQPDQTNYAASITDGPDADVFGLVGAYDFGTSAFALTIDQFNLGVTGVFRAAASGFTLNYDRTKTDPAQVIAQLNSLKIDLLALQQTGSPEPPSITVSAFTVRQNGFSFADATATFGDYTLAGIVKFGSLTVTLSAVNYTTGSAPTGTFGLSAASATLFPGSAATATLTTIAGSFDLVAKAFALSIGTLNATVGTTLTFNGSGIGFSYNPTGPPSQKVITADTLTAALPSTSITGTLKGLEITAAGGFSAVSLALDSSGLAKTLGLGEMLPFDITSLYAKFRGDTNGNGVRDPGETFSLTEFDLTVRGAFDFSKLSSLPFTPIIQIGPQGPTQQSFTKNTTQPFEFTVTVSSGGIKPKDIGPITIGFSDLNVGGTVTLGGTITLGGYQNGVFVPTFGGSFSLVANSSVSNVSGAASASLTGTFDLAAHTIAATGSLTVSFTYGDKVDIQNAQLGFALNLKADAGFAVSVTSFSLTSGSVGRVTLKFGSLMTLSATGATFNFNATGDQPVATFDAMSASFPGLLNLSGTATKFGFAASGKLLTQDGFGVTISADSGALKWPSWLPISIDKLGIVWKNFAADPLDFSIILSASVKSLNGLSALSVQGTVKDAVIDIGLLKDGRFPITSLGAVAISVSGDIFGGTASGALVLGMIRLDAAGNRIAAGDFTTPVAQRIMYGGIEAGFNFAGMTGFEIRVGISELGPLQVYLSVTQTQILEPISGLAITNFRAGVTFNTELPSITDPLKLRDPQFKPAAQMTLDEWAATLESAVVNQARAPPSANFWNVFTSPMRIEGGATLFSAYATTGTFQADVDILFDTRGKVVINARGVFGGTFSMNFRLYADLTQIQNSGTFLFLADLPQNPSTLTLRGALQFKFLQADGKTPATAASRASAFYLSLSGGMDATLANLGGLSIDATVNLTFEATRTTLDFNGTLKMGPLGDAVKAGGKFIFQHAGDDIELWGAARIEVKFNQLESKGIFAEGSALLQINTTRRDITESITLPGEQPASFTLKAYDFSVVINGALQMKREGANWFRLEGVFVLDLNPSGFDVLVDANLLIGDPKAPVVTVKAFGYFAIRSTGVAARIDLTLVGSFGGAAAKLMLNATLQLVFNTTGADVSYNLPAAANPVNGSRTVTVSGTAPGATTAGGYFYLDIRGELTIDGKITLRNGVFTLTVTPASVRLEASATFDLTVSGTKLMGFDVSGGFDISADGVAGAYSLTLRQGEGTPPNQGWSLAGTFSLQFNTKATAVTLNGATIAAGTTQVSVNGTLKIGSFSLVGGFVLTFAPDNVHIEATATLPVTVRDTAVLTFTVTGGMDVSSAGLATALTVSLAKDGGVPANQGWSFTATFRLEFNTRATDVTVAGIRVPANTVRIFANGTLSAAGFNIQGTFYLTIGTDVVTLSAQATGSILRNNFDVRGDLGIYGDGIAFTLSIKLPGIDGRAFQLRGDATLAINTTRTVRFGLAPQSGYIAINNVDLRLGDVQVSGSVKVSSNGRIEVPASNPLTFSILGQTAKVSGYLDASTGYYDLTGSINVNLGSSSVAGIAGTISLHLYHEIANQREVSGLDGTFNAAFRAFGIKILDLNGTAAFRGDGRFELTVNAGFTLASFVSINGSFSIKGDAGGVALAFNGNFDIFGKFKSTLSGWADSHSGKWNLFGSASASFGGKDLGASISATVVLGNTPYVTTITFAGRQMQVQIQPGITISGSAWAMVEVSGIKFGIEGDFSTSLTGESVSVHVNGKVCVAICVSASKTVSINFRTGKVSLSNIGYATVFLDVNRNGVRDPGEPMTVTDATGSFSFDPAPENLPDTPATTSIFGSLDRNGDGVLTPDEGRFLLTGGRNVSTGVANTATVTLGDGETAGVTDFSGATVFFDANNNGVLDAGEYSVGTDGMGVFSFAAVFNAASTAINHLGLLRPFDLNHNGVIDPTEGDLLLIGGTALSDGTTNSAVILLGSAEGNAQFRGATVFLDVNHNGRLDPTEPSTTTTASGTYAFDGDQDEIEAGALGLLAPFDCNHNGVLDADEGVITYTGGTFVRALPDAGVKAGDAFTGSGTNAAASVAGQLPVAGATVFLDVNGNGKLDAGEVSVTSGANGGYTFMPAAISAQVAALGALAPFDTNHNGVIDGREGTLVAVGGTHIGEEHQPGDDFYDPDVLFSRNAPSGVLHLASATVFLDLNGNGRPDAGEPTTTSDANGFYTFLAAAEFHNDLGALKGFDVNGNGVIDPNEGVFVITGGVDRDTGLANPRTLMVAATNYGSIFGTQLTPLSELYTYLVLGGLTGEQANLVLANAFGLPHSFDALTFDLFSADLHVAGESSAKLISTVAQAGGEIIRALDEVHATAQGRAPLNPGDAEDFVVRALADYLAKLGPPAGTVVDANGNEIGGKPALDFHDASMLRTVIADAISHAGLALPTTDRLNAAITGLHTIVERVVALRDAALTDITGALARVNAVVLELFHPALDDLIAGRMSPDQFTAKFSAANLMQLIDAVNIPETNSAPSVAVTGGTALKVADFAAARGTAVSLQVSDPDDLPAEVAVAASSSNPLLIAPGGIQVIGTGSSRTLVLNPIAGRTGTATITITVSDPQHGSRAGVVTQQLTVTVVYTYAALMNDLAIHARQAAATPLPDVGAEDDAPSTDVRRAADVAVVASSPSAVNTGTEAAAWLAATDLTALETTRTIPLLP